MSEDILLVLSICEGRHLPAPPGYSVLAEAKFDYQILQSDPVPLTTQPDFNTELVWETDRKSLQQHRLHKSPVKVEFYASPEGGDGPRQLLGYVVLDTRAALEVHAGPADQPGVKWHRILGCRPKSAQELPSVELGLSLEPNRGPAGGSSVVDGTVEASSNVAPTASCRCWQLSDTSCSVVELPAPTATGGDQSSLVHSPPTRGPSAGGPAPLTPRLDMRHAWFQLGPADVEHQELFTLTVIVVYAQHLELLIPPGVQQLPAGSGFNFWYSLLDCDIVTDTFHNIMQPQFLAERAVTRVRCPLPLLCQYLRQLTAIDVHLCCGDLSLGSAAVPLDQLIDGLDSLPSRRLVDEAAHQLTSSALGRVPRHPTTGHSPAVGVVVELAHARVGGDGQCLSGGDGETTTRHTDHGGPVGENDGPAKVARHVAPPVDSTVQLDDTELTTDGARHESTLKLDSSGLSSDTGSPPMTTVRRAEAAAAPPSSADGVDVADDQPQSEPDRPRHFRFVLDLRKLCLFQSRRGRALLRFSYPHFGDASELSSGRVPLTCQPVTVPRGSFEFNFAAPAGWLHGTLRRFPLEVRLQTEEGELLATAHVPLLPVTQQRRVHTTSSVGVSGFQQTCLCCADLVASGGVVEGQLSVVMSLDDLGAARLDKPPPPPPPPLPPADQQDSRLDSEMYAAARELEQWKQDQKILFQNQLQQREASHLATLTDEWKRRDAERELQVQRRLRDAVALEDKLRTGLTTLEERQRRLDEREEELVKLRDQLQQEHQQIAGEVRVLTAEMQTECEKRVREEQQKAADAEATSRRLQQERAELDGRLAELQARLAGEADRPDVAQLERTLEAAVKSKLYYKQRWAETARELEERRAADTRLARERLEREKLELDRLRTQVTARDETSFLCDERRLLEELRGQVRALTPRETPTPADGGEDGGELLRRLREERRVLLATGFYSAEDAAVRELDRRICQLVQVEAS